jgi:hypothetical protein
VANFSRDNVPLPVLRATAGGVAVSRPDTPRRQRYRTTGRLHHNQGHTQVIEVMGCIM